MSVDVPISQDSVDHSAVAAVVAGCTNRTHWQQNIDREMYAERIDIPSN